MKEFKNKVAAITGSATGIGRAFAEEAALAFGLGGVRPGKKLVR